MSGEISIPLTSLYEEHTIQQQIADHIDFLFKDRHPEFKICHKSKSLIIFHHEKAQH